EAFVNSGIDVSAIFLPEDEDPDTIAKLHGSATKEYLEGLKSETKSLLECVLDALLTKYGVQSIKDLGAAQKGKLCEELSRSLSLVESKIEQAELISKAALKLMVERVHLEALVLGKTDAGQIFLNVEIEAEPGPETQDGAGSYRNIKDLPQLDRAILQAVIAKKEVLAEEVIRDADIMGEVCEDTRLFVEGLAQTINLKGASLDEKKELIKSLLSEFGPSWFAFWRQTHRILKDESVNVDKLFAECRKAVRRAQLKRALAQLDREISECDAEEVREELLQEKLEMGRRLNAV
ncbi:MAG: hypothetical protein GX589_03130, partial [Deltaproteobacteria bacterium]|nr:hypothetical protein [Deltaproteobacteria bacterium]